jgi:hypothetical protein
VTIDLRSTLSGFEVEKLREQLTAIDGDIRYTYFADVLRAFLSGDAGVVKEFQEDKRSLVAAAASCNPLADLSLLSKKVKNYALVACLNPSINFKLVSALQKHEHPAIPIFLAANSTVDPETKVFSALAYEQTSEIDGNIIDSWYEHSLDVYEESPSQSISEILQLLALEILGFYNEGGDFPFWQMLEDSEIEPTEKLWKAFGALPRVPKEIYSESSMAVNILIARELAAEKTLPREMIEELVQDDCPLGSDLGDDSWFISRSPRASIAFNSKDQDLLSRIIQEEIASLESKTEYADGSMGVLWRIAGNSNLKLAHIQLIHDFVLRSKPRFSHWMFNYDLSSMLEGGAYVDAPLLGNSSLPTGYQSVFQNFIVELKKEQP